MSTDDPVVLRLRGYAPPPGFDADSAVAAGRRSVRRRRWAAVTAGVTAVVAAVGVGAVATGRPSAGPDVRPAEVSHSASPAPTSAAPSSTIAPSSSLSVASARSVAPAGALSCDATPFELPAGGGSAEIFGVAPDGRVAVGAVWSNSARTPVVWRDGRLETDDQPATWIVANRSGVLAGVKATPEEIRAYVRRNGEVRELPTPAGYPAAVPMAVSENGDVFGTLRRGPMEFGDGPWRGGYNFHSSGAARDLDVVVWPAASPDSPRVVTDPGEATVVGVAGPDRVFAVVQVGRSAQRPYSWSVTGEGGVFPLPSGWTGFSVQIAADGHLYGVRNAGTLVRWNLPTGRVETFTGATQLLAGNAAGWFTAFTGHVEKPVLVAPNGTSRALPEGTPQWIDPDGRTLIGNDTSNTPVTWRCR